MKHLTLVRHAEAEVSALSDFDRGLTSYGKQIAKKTSGDLAGKWKRPDRIVSSPAKRALETAKIFASSLKYPPTYIVNDIDLYSGSWESLLDIVLRLPDTESDVMLVGHNPSIYSFVSFFMPGLPYRFPPCSLVFFRFDTNLWEEVRLFPPALLFTNVTE